MFKNEIPVDETLFEVWLILDNHNLKYIAAKIIIIFCDQRCYDSNKNVNDVLLNIFLKTPPIGMLGANSESI